MIDVECCMENNACLWEHVWLLSLKSTRQNLFMSFPKLVRLVILTAEHVYFGRPRDRFSAQGVISHNELGICS